MKPCKLWDGYVNPLGYGIIHRYLNGRRVKRSAHREEWERHHGPIPKGMHVHHRCENRACYEITHLELLTSREHIVLRHANSATGTNIRKTHCPQGHPYSGYNLRTTRTRYGTQRECRMCRNKKARDTRREKYATNPTFRAAVLQRDREWRRKRKDGQ